MSSPGIPYLVSPDLAAEQQANETRQAFARSLLSAGPSQYTGFGGAMDTLGSRLLGALVQRNANKQNLDIAKRYQGVLGNFLGGDDQAPQASAGPQAPASGPPLSTLPVSATPAIPGQPGTGVQSRPLPPLGSMPQGGISAPMATPTAAPTAPPAAGSPALNGGFGIPGTTARQRALDFMFSGPQEYGKAVMSSQAAAAAMTDAEKNAAEAYGRGTPEYNQYMQQQLAKNSAILFRQGQGGIVNGKFMAMPNAQGAIPSIGQDGNIRMDMAPGAVEAEQAYSQAKKAGQNKEEPAIAYDGNNQPVATNRFTMAHGGVAPPSAGAAAPEAAPSFRMQDPAATIQGIIGAPVTVTSGTRSPDHNAAVGGVPDSAHLENNHAFDFVPKGMTTGQAAQRLSQSGLPFDQIIDEGSHVHVSFAPTNRRQVLGGSSGGQPQGNGALLPELPQGTPQYLQGQGKDASDRHDAIVSAAAEAPVRIGILDNIIGLSQKGVDTGPGQEWQNAVLGYAANSPILSKVMGSQKENVAKFQELQKFTYQNAIQAWRAAGGTGTDSQQDAMMKATPNDHLFPAALQSIAKWGKAAEMAVQGRANAQDTFLQQNGNSPANQIKFEGIWRNSFDPKVFQYSLMSPQEKQNFAQHELKTPQAAKAFIAKQEQLKALGAIP